MPRNSLTNGKQAPDSFNTQLDECAYPLVMALAVGLTVDDYYADHIRPAANFVATPRADLRPGALGGAGRLLALDDLGRDRRPAGRGARSPTSTATRDSAAVWRGVGRRVPAQPEDVDADHQRASEPEPVLHPALQDRRPERRDHLQRRQRRPDARPARRDRPGLPRVRAARPAAGRTTPTSSRSLAVVDATIRKRTTDSRRRLPALQRRRLRRRRGRRPSVGAVEQGHRARLAGAGRRARPVGARPAATSRPPSSALKAMAAMGSGVGLIPEQAWDAPDLARSPFGTDPTIASIGFQNGKPAGSAAALTWSAGQFVRLMLDVSAPARCSTGPDYTVDRYVKHTPGQTTLTVTAPADRSPATGTRRSSPARRRRATRSTSSAVNQDDHTALTRTATAASDGSFSDRRSRSPAARPCSTSSPPTASGGDRACACARSCSTWSPGTLLFAADDPDGDDNGPGNYAYPTSANFKPGAYDLQRFEVYDAGDRIIFRVRTRDLTPTFGSPLGAQLVDVYVHIPGALADLDGGGVRAPATTRSAAALGQADRGPGLRPAVRRRRDRRHARPGDDHGQRRSRATSRSA